MLTCSIKETCKIWTELWDCLHDRNGYGGKVAEIYSYRLQEYSPAYHGVNHTERKDIGSEIFRNAAISLVYLVRAFCEEYECIAEIDNLTINDWLWRVGEPGYFNHRCRIVIIKKPEEAK